MNESAQLAEIGRKLREAAKDAGLSLRDLGDKMGVSRPTIYAYASGALRMSPARLRQAAEVTGKSVAYFDPKDVEDLDARSTSGQALRLIDALMGPPDPSAAAKTALDAIEHSREAETPGIKAEFLRRAGVALASKGDYVEAVQHLESARALFQTADVQDKAASCAQTLGYCYIPLGHIEKARTCFEAAREHLPEDEKWKGQVSLAALAERVGDFATAESTLSALLDDKDLDEKALTFVRANYASMVCTRGFWKSGQAQTETALEAAYRTGQTTQVAELMIQNGIALTHLGQFDEASLMLMRARDVTFSLQDESRQTMVELATGMLFAAVGDENKAREMVMKGMAKAMRGQYRRSESLALLLQAEGALDRGDDFLAREYAVQAKGHSVAHHYPVAQVIADTVMAIACARLGDVDAAETALIEAQTLAAKSELGEAAVRIEEARAAIALAKGNQDDAVAILEGAVEDARKLSLEPLAVHLLGLIAKIESGKSGNGKGKSAQDRAEDAKRALNEKAAWSESWSRALVLAPSKSGISSFGRNGV
ncbi:MAG: helix-turn-helix domain-containing protein [Fimbriimonadaceae bacterium]|nr:helix-turn-helix domain-containing protein [Fimbriimonadaceae bacterium]QYK55373.1 MAG: helix-turn-helix domain-containing protein [Fimbriimonadaceae bacterium]